MILIGDLTSVQSMSKFHLTLYVMSGSDNSGYVCHHHSGSRLRVATCCYSTQCKSLSQSFCVIFFPRMTCLILHSLQVTENKSPGGAESALRKAEDVVSGMLAKGFVLGKDAVNKAKNFDEKHQLTSTASEKVASFDKKIGLSEKISAGTSVVGDKVREVDQKFQVSEKTKSAFAAAEQTVSNAGSAIMKNRYVFTSASWVTGAFNKVAKAAGEVGQKTKEKVGMVEEEKHRKIEDDYAQVLSDSPKASAPSEHDPSKPEPVKGLIL